MLVKFAYCCVYVLFVYKRTGKRRSLCAFLFVLGWQIFVKSDFPVLMILTKASGLDDTDKSNDNCRTGLRAEPPPDDKQRRIKLMNSPKTPDAKIQAMRNLMRQNDIDAYIISNGDDHINSRVADHWKAMEWISGFTGSYGVVIVTAPMPTSQKQFRQISKQKISIRKISSLYKRPLNPILNLQT